jgi:hypothetical protein
MSVGSLDIITDGLVFYVDAGNDKSYPGFGSNCYDLTSNGNNGTLENGPTFDFNGPSSFVFDGVNDFINVNYNSSFNLTQDFTMGVWVKTSSYTNNYQGIFNLFDQTPITYNGFGITINDQFKKYTLLVAGSSGSFEYIYADDDFILDDWYFICGVNVSGTSYLYVNGVQQVDTSTLSIVAPLNNLRMGNFYDTPFGLFNGNISQGLLYNRALTPQEILHNYNKLKWRFL